MCYSLGKHGFASARWAVQQHPPGGVNANLPVQLMVRQGELHCLLDLLFLNVIASNILKAKQRMALKWLDVSHINRGMNKSRECVNECCHMPAAQAFIPSAQLPLASRQCTSQTT